MMMQDKHKIPITILICDDDEDDRMLTQQALEQSKGNIDQALFRVFMELYSRAPYPEEVEMKEEMVKGIVLGYFCRRCGYQVDVESITSLG